MSPSDRPPCYDRLDADCFEKRPEWAKQAFAYRLLRMLMPDELSRLLPTTLQQPPEFPWEGAVPPPDPPPVMAPPAMPVGVQSLGPVASAFVSISTPGPPPPAKIATPPPSAPEPLSIYSSITDGTITASNAVWATLRNTQGNAYAWTSTASESNAMTARFFNNNYYIRRSWLYFDLSTVPSGSTILAVTVNVIGHVYDVAEVTIQEGTQQDALVASDWLAFTGTYFAKTTWTETEFAPGVPNVFTLNAAGIQYVQDNIGGTAKFSMREYDLDYLNAPPTDSTSRAGCFFANNTEPTFKPHIIITYE